jgi:hypothetical protein
LKWVSPFMGKNHCSTTPKFKQDGRVRSSKMLPKVSSTVK